MLFTFKMVAISTNQRKTSENIFSFPFSSKLAGFSTYPQPDSQTQPSFGLFLKDNFLSEFCCFAPSHPGSENFSCFSLHEKEISLPRLPPRLPLARPEKRLPY